MSELTNRLRAYILERHLPGESAENLTDGTRLQSSGILDSLAVLELASYIEVEFGVELSASDTTAEGFDRLADIETLVERRRGGAPDGLRRAS